MVMKRQRFYHHQKFCEHCNDAFHASRYDAKFCSCNCRQASRRAAAKLLRADDAILEAIDAYLDMQQNDLQLEYALNALRGHISGKKLLNDQNVTNI